MKRLWGLALIVIISLLIPWHTAAAAAAAEYGMITSQQAAGAQGAKSVGAATSSNLAKATAKPSSFKKKKGKG